MDDKRSRTESHWSLALDLLSARALVWAITAGRHVELRAEAHLYFFDRYSRLADYHRSRGHMARARRLQQKADEHFRAGGFPDGPPYAAAAAMPRPSRFLRTNGVAKHRIDGPDDAA